MNRIGNLNLIIYLRDTGEDNGCFEIMSTKNNSALKKPTLRIDDKKWDKNKLDTETTCYFKSQFSNYKSDVGPKYGIIPKILKDLLYQRSETKKKMKRQ